MTRLKFFRILIPALLLPFLLILALTVRERPVPHLPAGSGGLFGGPRMEQIDLTDLSGGARRFGVEASTVQQDEQGDYHLEGIKRLVYYRDEAPPLIASADRGGVKGGPGKYLIRLEGGVKAQEEDQGLRIALPTLEVDEAAGEARSIGEVQVEDPAYRGRAASVVYGLRKQPTTMTQVELHGEDGLSLTAEHGRFLDGSRDMEFTGDVRLERGGNRLESGMLRLQRDEARKPRHAFASEHVVGTGSEPGEATRRFEADRAEMEWDDDGHPAHLVLDGNACLEEGDDALTASRIEATRSGAAADSGWDVVAEGDIRATGTYRDGPALVSGDAMKASIDAEGRLLRGEIEGEARFEGTDTVAEASRIEFAPGPGSGSAVLHSGPRRRARLARERTRVVADEITTDAAGTGMDASGRVEATLLPAPSGTSTSAHAGGFFKEGEAVHFVAAKMHGTSGDSRVQFEGSVRGWQGDQNLAADRVDVRQTPEELHATGNVSTRIHRAPTSAVSEADYIRVVSDRLDYSAADRKAIYSGSVRVTQAEGWLDAAKVDVLLGAEGEGVREVVASGKVHLEFHAAPGKGAPQPVVGEGDRVVYEPGEQTVRLFGDETAATLRKTGEDGGTTSGRVLRYRVDLGTIEVESGDRNRARIRTTGK